MQEKHLYEYAVIRVVPKVEREEFVNVGVILFCKREQFLKVRLCLNTHKIKTFASETDMHDLEEHLNSFEQICTGSTEGGPIAQMDMPSRFRWLTAVRSSVIQTSRPHPGFSENLAETLERLFMNLVL